MSCSTRYTLLQMLNMCNTLKKYKRQQATTSKGIMANRPVTRSMTRYRQGVLIKDILCTPGVMTHIAEQFASDDPTLPSLYLLFMDDRVQFELDPYMTHFKKAYEMRITDDIVSEIRANIKRYMQEFSTINDDIKRRDRKHAKATKIIELFEYLCTRLDYLPWLGKAIANTFQCKILEFKESYRKTWFINDINKIESKMASYFEWYERVKYDDTVPLYTRFNLRQ